MNLRLKSAELKIIHLEPKAALSDDYEKQIILLKDEIRLLKAQNDLLAIRSRPVSPIVFTRTSRERSKTTSPLRSALRSSSHSRFVFNKI